MSRSIDADSEKAIELCPLFIEYAKRRISRPGKSSGLLEDPLEHRLGVQLRNQLAAHP
jgi:hypothetical protein